MVHLGLILIQVVEQGTIPCSDTGAATDYFGLSIMLWGHRRRGVYSPPFSLLENCNGRVKYLHCMVGYFGDIVNKTGE